MAILHPDANSRVTPEPYWLTAAFATAREALGGATSGLTEEGIRQHAKLLSLSPDQAEATWARRLLDHYEDDLPRAEWPLDYLSCEEARVDACAPIKRDRLTDLRRWLGRIYG